ncbi:MAG: SBBP repeat-containing protein [Verrucomicrobia bacterium]|nr:SBBP repeat-containing protein [Verrucomicrobiota bacterium]
MTKDGRITVSKGRAVPSTPRTLRNCSFAILSSLIGSVPLAAAEADSPGSASLSRFGNLPLYFEANHGQTDQNVGFYARGQNHTVYLRPNGATIALSSDSSSATQPFTRRYATNSSEVRFVHMTLLGSKPAAASTGLDPLSGRVNYLLGNNSARWQQSVPTFGKVQYTSVYEGIDLVYYGNNQELEYDFYIAPKIDPSVIALKFDGADRLSLDAGGNLVLKVGANELHQKKPVAYQTIAGKRRDVAVRYEISGQQTVSFALGSYDAAQPLVIDPLLSYSTYLGGAKGDIGWAIAVDADGRAYIAGDTLSIFKKLPTSGQQTNSGGGTRYGGDAFVARLDFNETNQSLTLGYLTYFGGDGLDSAIGIAVDTDGAAYITGYTTSTNFPTSADFGNPAAFQPEIAGDTVLSVYKGDIVGNFNSTYPDAFVTKLDTNGLGVYSTYLGGELSESGTDIAVDSTGAAYVVGYTESALTFLISNRVETARCTNGVCGTPTAVTNITTTSLLVASSTVTNDLGIQRSTTNTLQSVVTTTLLSPINAAPYFTGFPVANAIQTNNGSQTLFSVIRTRLGDKRFVEPGTNVLINLDTPADFFITKLSPDATSLTYSTYLGGNDSDLGTGIAVAPDGSVSVSGYTISTNFPTTNAFQSALSGVRDAAVAKLNTAGDTLIFSTYLGGRGSDTGYRLAVDAAGATYVTGASGSTDFPSTPGALNGGGVFASTNTSGSWLLSSSGLSHTIVSALIADPFNAGTLYSGTPRGVFKSTDSGTTWVNLSTGLVNLAVNALAIEPLTGSPVYAGTSAGLYQSTDGGLNWTNAEPELGPSDVRAIFFDSATGTNLFVGTSSGVYARTNDTNWSPRTKGLRSRSVRVLLDDPSSLLYAGTDSGVHKSTNWGVNWTAMNKGLKTTKVRALVIDPANAATLYAGTTKGIFKTVDAGTNWTELTNGIGKRTINSLLIDPGSSLTLYAGTTNGLFRSTDAGSSWSLSNSNLTAGDVTKLIFAPGSTDTIYAGTRGTNFAGGTNDAFLVKFAPDGLALEYALTFGGNRNDEGWDVAVDGDGNAYVTGQTASRNFPVRGPAGSFTNTSTIYQTNMAGKIDAFLVKMNADGSSNELSFYHGGKKTDIGHSIALDTVGNAYIVGRTESTKLPTTNSLVTLDDDALKFSGKRDAFVTKFLTGTPALSLEPLITASASGSGSSLIRVSWPASSYEFRLEARNPNGGEWFPITKPITKAGGRSQVILPASSSTLLFRLRM